MIKVLKSEDYNKSTWAGGATTQLAISPANAEYADRDFIWRVSSAVVELQSSDFTVLPDYNRLISVIEGSINLSHSGGELINLAPYDIHSFDGGADTRSEGICTDFNLMTRKGKCIGELEAINESSRKVPAETGLSWLFYCTTGEAVVSIGDDDTVINAGESILAENAGTDAEITAKGVGFLARMRTTDR